MASDQFNHVSYGFTQPLISEFSPPIVSQRDPTVNDKAPLGTLWVNTLTNATFIITSIVANQSNWAMGNGGAGVFTLTGDTGGPINPLGGNIDILGTAGEVSVNGAGNSLTVQLNAGFVPVTVPNGGTGLITITDHAVLVGSGVAAVTPVGPGAVQTLFQGMGAAADPVFTADPVISGTLTAGMELVATGDITTLTGDIVADAGNIRLPNPTPTEGIVFVDGVRFINAFDAANPLWSTFIGSSSGNLTATGTNNDGHGYQVLSSVTTGNSNSGFGNNALLSLTEGVANAGFGNEALLLITTGTRNTAFGVSSLDNIDTGEYNIALGFVSGTMNTGADSSNIMIGHLGVSGESNTIRIGTQGNGSAQQDSCFIAGITGVTVANSAAVLINTATGELGTVVSSRRFKDNIKNLSTESSPLLDLQPVSFTYKEDETETPQWGLIAEDVAESFPDLVVYDNNQQPYTVRYHDIPVLLLNEVKKLAKRIDDIESLLQQRKG